MYVILHTYIYIYIVHMFAHVYSAALTSNGCNTSKKKHGSKQWRIFPKPWQKIKKLIGSNSKLQIGAKLGAFTPPQNNPRWGWNSKNHQESLASPPNTPDKLLVGTSPQIIAKDSTSYRRISWFTQIAPCFYNQFCWWYHKIHVWPDYWLHNAINIRFTD